MNLADQLTGYINAAFTEATKPKGCSPCRSPCTTPMRPEVIWDSKAERLKKNNLLKLHQGKESFEPPGGLGSLKSFCSLALSGPEGQACGSLLLGVPGSGKGVFTKGAGLETGRLDGADGLRWRHRGQCLPGSRIADAMA